MKEINGDILVVDDESTIRRICERILSNIGLNVKTATAASGEEALARIKENKWDCVLTDILMPGTPGGMALTEEIKNRFPNVDVIIMTGSPAVETAVGGLGLGLAIVRRIVEAHGGSILVTSKDRVGSEFITVFPKRLLQETAISSKEKVP